MSMHAGAAAVAELLEPEHEAFRDSFRTFLARRVTPHYGDWERIPAAVLRAAVHHEVAVDEEHPPAGLATVLDGELEISADGTVRGSAAFVPGGHDAAELLCLGEQAAVRVAGDAPGVSARPSDPGIGLDAAGFADFELCGAAGTPVDAVPRAISELALGLAVSAIAGARSALKSTVEYVRERRAFGTPIATFQNTREVLAGLEAELEAGEALLGARQRERLQDGPLPLARAAALELCCTELYGRAVDACVQLHGGYGYIMEYPIAHAYADARFWRLSGGCARRAARAAIADSVLH
jgi:alkylation response protein AidB-like acyl-CoA dehydrogenase